MGVILTIKNKDTKKQLEQKINKIKKLSSGFPAHKYTGKIKFDEDGVTYQRRIRDEWE